MKRHRNEMETMSSILSVVLEENRGINPTKILKKANLSNISYKRYVSILKNKNLIEEREKKIYALGNAWAFKLRLDEAIQRNNEILIFLEVKK